MQIHELQKDKLYWCDKMGKWVKYCGTQQYEGEIYYNFFEAGMGLFYWLNPEDVTEDTTVSK